jgi:hypothetical protein
MDYVEQRNRYKGVPPRPWLRLRLIDLEGVAQEYDFLADTGNPFALIVSAAAMARFKQGDGPDVETNFGVLTAGHVRVAVPEVNIIESILAYSSETVSDAARASSPEFEGLVGLPLLRTMEYGGDADSFWIRVKSGAPFS